MNRRRILVGLLTVLFIIGATSLLFASPFMPGIESYPERGENSWEGIGYATLPEVKADIGEAVGMKGMKEIEITAKWLGYNCGYMVMLRNEKGDMRVAEGRFGNTFSSDWNGEGSYIFHIDSKMLNDFKYVDIYSEPGCKAAVGNRLEKVASIELK